MAQISKTQLQSISFKGLRRCKKFYGCYLTFCACLEGINELFLSQEDAKILGFSLTMKMLLC